jgi:hypothetical protein
MLVKDAHGDGRLVGKGLKWPVTASAGDAVGAPARHILQRLRTNIFKASMLLMWSNTVPEQYAAWIGGGSCGVLTPSP